MKIKGLKKAVGDYQRVNSDGPYSPCYGEIMLDAETGEIWTDEFCSLGHNEWKEYHNPAVVNLSRQMREHNLEVTMKNVRDFIEANYMD